MLIILSGLFCEWHIRTPTHTHHDTNKDWCIMMLNEHHTGAMQPLVTPSLGVAKKNYWDLFWFYVISVKEQTVYKNKTYLTDSCTQSSITLVTLLGARIVFNSSVAKSKYDIIYTMIITDLSLSLKYYGSNNRLTSFRLCPVSLSA